MAPLQPDAPQQPDAPLQPNDEAVPFIEVKRAELEEIGSPGSPAPGDQLLGLAFSGGGIRSATFNLGILQALAQLKLLHCFDYLSTVSGGGYIGSWLHAWIRDEDQQSKDAGRLPDGMSKVEEALSPHDSPDPNADNVRPIQFLRRYSNYLTPQVGLFSADTWTMIAIWMRNTLLNLLILVAFLSAMLLIPRWLIGLTWLAQASLWAAVVAALLAAAALGVAVYYIGLNLRLLDKTVGTPQVGAAQIDMPPPAESQPANAKYLQGGIEKFIVAPVFIAAWLGSAAFSRYVNPRPNPDLPLWIACMLIGLVFFSFLVLVAKVGKYDRCFYQNAGHEPEYSPSQKSNAVFSIYAFAAIAAVVGGAVLYGLANYLQAYCNSMNVWHVMSWGTPVLMTVFTLVIVLYIGLLGTNLPDDRREWWSRLGAWVSIYIIGWAGLFVLSLYGPLLISWSIDSTAGAIAGTSLGIGWIASTVGGVASGASKKTGRNTTTGAEDSSALMGLIAKVAPVIFIIGLLLGLSFAIHLIALQFIPCPNQDNATLNAAFCRFSLCTGKSVLPGYNPLWQDHWLLLEQFLKSPYPSLLFAGVCLLFLALSAGLSRRIDINEFSLHNFYKNRLVRCYLGANRGDKRKPNPFTGFDGDDDVHLARFSKALAGYTGPYPIINTALNLVHGENLAWQERKAESFILTPRYCGFDMGSGRATHAGPAVAEIAEYAYRPTAGYAYPVPSKRAALKSGVHIGTAMATSGAAASPNMGANSSATSAFLMTVFDVRLGWWLGNPRHNSSFNQSDPAWGLGYLLAELFGYTDDRSKHVYLSDGGHFENLGIYELARRECRYIVACDSEEDHDFKFGGLGNAIRKCRSDFGAEIDIAVDQIRRDPSTMRSGSHCVVGNIRYKSGKTGYLVYIKSSLTGDEPSDVLQYASDEPAFPHESTADQWFNESQFESYRKLGYHVGMQTFERVKSQITLCGDSRDSDSREAFFAALRQQWYPPSTAIQKSFTRHTDKLDLLMERLRTDPKLAFLDAQFYREWRQLMTHPEGEPARIDLWLPETQEEIRSGFYFCSSLIQLMENVYIDLNLDRYYDHPDNRGWMRVFSEWVASGMFRITWAITADTFGARFQTFFQTRLNQHPGDVGRDRVDDQAAASLTPEERAWMEKTMNPGDWLYSLHIEMRDREGGAPAMKLRFGLALQDSFGKLRGLFVQGDLRNLGLERRAAAMFGADAP